jgi:glycosyltransferase involved in cell wall biosynthesis
LWLRRRGYPFTTSYHTRFPEYVAARGLLPLAWGYRFERWFHGAAERTLVGTRSLIAELRSEGVGRALVHWPRGVDAELFSPERANASLAPAPRPVWLSVGRIAVEKSLADFLALDLPGTKVVVGDGPDRAELERRFPEARFLGYRFGPDLASLYASADCFVFPSRTETFGNVILEALASGLPVAATSAPGPVDLIEEGVNGSVQTPLLEACWAALRCSRAAARRSALRYSWEASHERFVSHLAPIPARPDAPSFTSAGAAAVPS